LVGFAVYFNSFGNEFFWDDEDLITKNVYVQSFRVDKFFSENEIAGVGQISNYWRPLLLISFALDYKLWGLHPVGFHLTNTLFHIFNAWLLFFIFGYLLVKRLKNERGYLLSFLASLIFLIHPLQTEAVTYTAGRGDPMSALLSLLAIGTYVLFREKKRPCALAASLIFFAAALLVKEQAVFLPLLLFLVEFIFYSETGFKKTLISWVKRLWPFFVVSLIYAILRLTVLNFNDILSGVEHRLGGNYDTSVWTRLLTFCSVALSYLKLLFIPTGLHMAREVAPVTSIFSWPVAGFLSLAGSLSFVSVKLWKRNRLIVFGLLWCAIILLPRTNIISVNRPMYEHWLYLPIFGFWLAAFSVLSLLYERLRPVDVKKVFKVLGVVVFIFLFFLFSFLTVSRNFDWQGPITFYEKNLRYTPNSYIQMNNLAMAYADQGRHEEAIAMYRKSLSVADVYPQVHYNLGNSLVAVGQKEEASKEYRRAIEISPEFFVAYVNLIGVLNDSGQKEAVLELFDQGGRTFANVADFWYLKGVILYRWGENEAALASFNKAGLLAPGDQNIQRAISGITSILSK
jgi:protein O-mannosyl-transferase